MAQRRLWRLTTTVLHEPDVAVLLVEGRLGHAVTAELEATGRALAGGARELVIDLSGVDYISSAALQVIAALAADRAHRGDRLSLRAPSIPVRLALELSGLLHLCD